MQVETTSAGASVVPMRWVKAEKPHRERVPRWRWCPWIKRDFFWTSLSFPEGGTGYVAADSQGELHTLIAEQIRFWYDEPSTGVGWWW